MSCKHERFSVQGTVSRLTSEEGGEVHSYTLDVEVWCDECKQPFQFVGLPGGWSPAQPMVSADGLEARMPIKPLMQSTSKTEGGDESRTSH